MNLTLRRGCKKVFLISHKIGPHQKKGAKSMNEKGKLYRKKRSIANRVFSLILVFAMVIGFDY